MLNRLNAISLSLAMALALLLNACLPFTTIVNSLGEPPIPVMEQDSAIPGYQQVSVDHVEVEIGVGSPIPIYVVVSGNLPDTCSQVEYTEVKQNGSDFRITLSAIPSNDETCIQDTLPFRMSIPLNVSDLPADNYSVTVNGSRADFSLDTGSVTSSLPLTGASVTKHDIQVDDVSIEVGVGSPIPVKAVVSGNLPNVCAQLGEVRLHRAENIFFVQLLAYLPEKMDCTYNSVPPFRLEIPLNVVNLPKGTYEVNVNGAPTSFDPYEKNESANLSGCTNPVEVPISNGKVVFDDISFTLDPALSDAVTAQSCPAVSLSEDLAHGEAHPLYTVFLFPNFARGNTDFQPEVRVYDVTHNMQEYPFPFNRLLDLRNALDQRAKPIVWYAAPLHTRETYLDFNSGAGVRGLIQYMQDFFFFTNNGLTYEFNGLTQDGHYFVTVRYPVSVPFLMELEGSLLPPDNSNPKAIPIPEWPDIFEQQLKIIEDYNAEALRRFEQMSDDQSTPDIALLDALVESIQVNKP